MNTTERSVAVASKRRLDFWATFAVDFHGPLMFLSWRPLHPDVPVLECLVFEEIRFDQDAAQDLIKALRTLRVFSSPSSLRFVGRGCSSTQFVDFVMQCLNRRESLTTL
jgi:hypothetical protein